MLHIRRMFTMWKRPGRDAAIAFHSYVLGEEAAYAVLGTRLASHGIINDSNYSQLDGSATA